MSGLAIGSLTLDPTFSPEKKSYTLETRNNTNRVTAHGEADADIAISLSNANGVTDVPNGTAAAWAGGENVLTVTLSKGSARAVYTVNVTQH